MRANGSQAYPLTNDTTIHHAPIVWSADGRYLLFQRAFTGDAKARPALWVYQVESETFREIASPGRLGMWLP
jgi:Tol biopolymer transport system component